MRNDEFNKIRYNPASSTFLLVVDLALKSPHTHSIYDTNFDAPDAHFDKLCLFNDAQTKMLEIRNMKVKLYGSEQCSAKDWSQIRQRIELWMRQVILRFEMTLYNLLFP